MHLGSMLPPGPGRGADLHHLGEQPRPRRPAAAAADRAAGGWLSDPPPTHARAGIVRQTLTGALDSLDARVATLADASTSQVKALETLRHDASTAYADASRAVASG